MTFFRKPKAQITQRQIAAINNFNSLASGRGPVAIPAARAKSRDLEFREQVGVMKWWRDNYIAYGIPERLLFAIPNGGDLGEIKGAKMKAAGTRSGVSDLFLAVPVGAFHGAFIEMKSTEGRESDEQEEFGKEVRRQGYRQVTCFGAGEAIQFITDYLNQGA